MRDEVDDRDNPYRSPAGASLGPAIETLDHGEPAARRANGLLAIAGALGLCLAMMRVESAVREVSLTEHALGVTLSAGFGGALLGAGLNMSLVFTGWPKPIWIPPLSIAGALGAAIVRAVMIR